MTVAAQPYEFPIGGTLEAARTALVIIDMQRDFCEPHGYVQARGDDISATRAIIPHICRVRDAAQRAGMMVIYTREGHRPNLADLPQTKRRRTARAGAEIGSAGPLGRLLIRGEPGWDFVAELKPRPQDTVIDKPGTGAFRSTDLHHVLTASGVDSLVLVGVTTAVCVTSTAREASDLGYGVLVLGDCCAEPDPANHEMALKLLQIEGGYIATVSTSEEFIKALANEREPAASLEGHAHG
jgi:nicotinamidase-related amidase